MDNEKLEQQIKDLQQENEFLRKRENKLQMIELLFANGIVDLRELNKIVKEKDWN